MKAYGKLTNKQKEVLDFIKSFCASNKYPPSVREICHGLGTNSPATIHTHIKKLIDKGYIQRGENGNKQLKLLVNNEYENAKKEIKTSLLNDCIKDAYLLNLPPSYKGKRLKIYFSHQVSNCPPTFDIEVNNKGLVHFSYERYIENKIRESFDLEGTPIVINFKNKGEIEM